MSLPIVAIVGRPNVGKSSLFNWLAGRRISIVDPTAGVTRDRVSTVVEAGGRFFELTDTGGMFGSSEDPLHELVLERGRRAIHDADLLVLVVDGREGLVGGDREIAQAVREAGKPALLEECWFHGTTALPVVVERPGVAVAAAMFHRACEDSGVAWGGARSVIVCPHRFNALLDRWGSKSIVLLVSLAELLQHVLDLDGQDPIFIFVDKHGGRNFYTDVLQKSLPRGKVEPVGRDVRAVKVGIDLAIPIAVITAGDMRIAGGQRQPVDRHLDR